jgi:hypothetical protein
MFEAFGDHPQGEGLDLRQGIFLGLAVSEDARQLEYFCQPAAIVLSLRFDLERDQQITSLRATSIRRGPRRLGT